MTATLSPPTDARLERFGVAWEGFFRALRRGRARLVDHDRAALTLPQYQLVEPLGDGIARHVGELAGHAGVSPPTATRMLDGLERAGLVERRHSARDRRRVEVALTASGQAAVADVRAQVLAARRRVFEALEPAEREAAERLLLRLAQVVDAL